MFLWDRLEEFSTVKSARSIFEGPNQHSLITVDGSDAVIKSTIDQDQFKYLWLVKNSGVYYTVNLIIGDPFWRCGWWKVQCEPCFEEDPGHIVSVPPRTDVAANQTLSWGKPGVPLPVSLIITMLISQKCGQAPLLPLTASINLLPEVPTL